MNINYVCEAGNETGYHAHSKAFWGRLSQHNDGIGPPITLVLSTSDHYDFYKNYGNDIKICYNVYESTIQPTKFFNHILNNYDYFWCPSSWQAECTIAQGFPEDRVKVVPEGVDGSEFFPISDDDLADKFTFIIVGKYEYRKSTEEMINCWLETFPLNEYPDLKLILLVDNIFDPDNTEKKLATLMDPRIERLRFLSREVYIKTLQSSHIFLSCSRSEGWGLPIIEAIACGIPTICLNYSAPLDYCKDIAHFVNVKEMKPIPYFPGEFAEPDFDHFKQVMINVCENWLENRKKALIGSNFVRQQFSWDNAVKIALEHLTIIERKIPINNFGKDVRTIFNFVDGLYFELQAPPNTKYNVRFIDKDSNRIHYLTTLGFTNTATSCWATPSPKYFVNWRIEVERVDDFYKNDNTIVIKEDSSDKLIVRELDFAGKNVFINLDSKALGDNLAWIPYVEKFREKHNCNVYVSTFWNNILEKAYPELHFKLPGEATHNIVAQYKVGCFDNDYTRNKINWREVPLQKVATDILGLQFEEIQPRVHVPEDIKFNYGRKYVCISTESTMQSKYWNHPDGWQTIIDYLTDELNYEVISVSKNPTNFSKLLPVNNTSIENVISVLNNCHFFIGLGSGLSWLAWALNKKVIMISGFSKAYTEFISNNYRITPPDINTCYGCFNDVKYKFDRSWEWCPRNKNYECTKTITPEIVKENITKLLNEI
jgi:autotransporter strand-loop-strand O-heptosyltransferase